MSEQAGDRKAPRPASEVAPLDVDGVVAVAVGTVAWAVALVVLLPFTSRLRDDGHLWWLATCGLGVLLGLAGLWFVTRRRRAIRRAASR